MTVLTLPCAPQAPRRLAVRNYGPLRSVTLDLRPLTVVTGGNGTGKSTLLSACSIYQQLLCSWQHGGALATGFSHPPYTSGAFEQLQTRRANTDAGIGISGALVGPTGAVFTCTARWHAVGGQPELSMLRWEFGDAGWLELHATPAGTIEFVTPVANCIVKVPPRHATWVFENHIAMADDQDAAAHLGRYLARWLPAAPDSGHHCGTPLPPVMEPLSMGPLRTFALRTYEAAAAHPDIDGSRAPAMMHHLHLAERARWDALHAALQRFGQQSGLFDDIRLRRLDRTTQAPFQVQVKRGHYVNLVDAGHAVAQVLPPLVALYYGAPARLHLLQSPDLLLDARAQAALADSLLGAAHSKSRIVVETTSDALVAALLERGTTQQLACYRLLPGTPGSGAGAACTELHAQHTSGD